MAGASSFGASGIGSKISGSGCKEGLESLGCRVWAFRSRVKGFACNPEYLQVSSYHSLLSRYNSSNSICGLRHWVKGLGFRVQACACNPN